MCCIKINEVRCQAQNDNFYVVKDGYVIFANGTHHFRSKRSCQAIRMVHRVQTVRAIH